MSGERCAFLDRSPGETRAVVLLDGRPERLLFARDGDPAPRLGALYAGRVTAVSPRMGLARVDLGEAVGALRLRGLATAPCEGERLAVEVAAEPGHGKPAALRLVGPATGGIFGLIQPAPSIEVQLAAFGCPGWETGEAAREQADIAQAQALAREHAATEGPSLTIEPTRALVAVDVDLADTGAPVSVSRANLVAVQEAARLLRLKALGGLAAIDLIGFPKDGRRLQAAAVEAFAPDGAEVAVAAPSRFGVMELSKPHRLQPVHERLLDFDGRLSARTLAQAALRALERQGRFAPGARMAAVCTPDVAAEAMAWVAQLGPRFSVRADLGAVREHPDIMAL